MLLAKFTVKSMKNMLLDNVRIHHAKLFKPFLDENKDRLKLMFLPAYNPELNLIEGGGYEMVKIIYYLVSRTFKVKLIYICKSDNI